MRKFRSVLVALATVAFALVAFQPMAVHATSNDPFSVWRSIIRPNTDYIVSASTLTLKGVTRQQVASFTSDVRNDVYWYPGVLDAQRVSGNGGKGTLYTETINFGGTTFTGNVSVLAYLQGHYIVEYSYGGFVESTGLLIWEDAADGAKFTLYGLIPAIPGVPIDVLRQQLAYADNLASTNLLNHFNTTGTTTYTNSVIHTPNF